MNCVCHEKLFHDVRGYSMLQMICQNFASIRHVYFSLTKHQNDGMSIAVDNLHLCILNFISDPMIHS